MCYNGKMSTRRAETDPARPAAIRRFRELMNGHTISRDCPEASNTLALSLKEVKPHVYAGIGIVAAHVVDATLKPELLTHLQSLHNVPAILDKRYREALYYTAEHYTKEIACPHLRKEITAYKDAFKMEAFRSPMDPVTHLVLRGINTYVCTASAVYRALRQHDSQPAPSAADRIHGSYRILDSLAKLHIEQFIHYSESSLLNHVSPGDSFTDHIELNRDSTGYQFKHTALAKACYVRYPEVDSNLQDVYRIEDFDTDESQVGCPVTFRPNTTRKLWEFYAQARLGSSYTPPMSATAEVTTYAAG